MSMFRRCPPDGVQSDTVSIFAYTVARHAGSPEYIGHVSVLLEPLKLTRKSHEWHFVDFDPYAQVRLFTGCSVRAPSKRVCERVACIQCRCNNSVHGRDMAYRLEVVRWQAYVWLRAWRGTRDCVVCTFRITNSACSTSAQIRC